MTDLVSKDLTTLTFTQDELKIISAIIIQTKFSLIDAQAVTPIYNKFRNVIKDPPAPKGPQDHKKGK
jgi:hypothetical protein